MSNVPTEQELQAAAVAPRVVEDDIAKEIKSVEYLYHGLLTICILTFHNGFTVDGKSACVSPENYNREFGEKFAYRDAKRKIGQFLGFRLADKLYTEKQANAAVEGLSLEDDCEGCKI